MIEKVREQLHLESKVPRALDVGCGAGLSTIALLPLAEEVVGIDASEEMVKAATPNEHVQYHHCPAEQLADQLAFPADYFQVITVCGALNWIDRDQFFAAARRVLCSSGWIVVYDNVFMGTMRGQSSFATWYASQFLSRYPRPPRDERPLKGEECSGFGFQFVHSAAYTNEIAYSLDQFIDYLLTLTNLTVPLAQGRETEVSAREWFRGGLATFFGSGSQGLEFGGYIWYLQRA